VDFLENVEVSADFITLEAHYGESAFFSTHRLLASTWVLRYARAWRQTQMAAILDKNGSDGKPIVLPTGLTNSEVLKCERDCPFSFTLAYGAVENRIEDGQNILDLLRREARTVIKYDHPLHLTDTYVWGGPKKGWLDREKATAAGL
jgi:hypothetical protein